MTDLVFTSRDRFHINQRGWVYYVDLPDELWNAERAPKLAGKHVRIDGNLHRVRGVLSAHGYGRPGHLNRKTVGLLVSGS